MKPMSYFLGQGRRYNRLAVIAVLIGLFVLPGCAPEPPGLEAWPTQKRAQAHVDLGKSYLQRGKLDVARETFEKALQVDPSSSEAYHGLGLVEAQQLDFSLARDYLKRAVQLDKKNSRAVSDYAVILCGMGSAKTGLNVLDKHVPEPTVASLSTRLAYGRCYEADHEYARAEIAYQGVLREEPDLQQALLSMAGLKYRAERYLSASGFMQRYFYTSSMSADALLLASNIENELDNIEERDYYTRQLWTLYPNSKQATKAREQFSQ